MSPVGVFLFLSFTGARRWNGLVVTLTLPQCSFVKSWCRFMNNQLRSDSFRKASSRCRKSQESSDPAWFHSDWLKCSSRPYTVCRCGDNLGSITVSGQNQINSEKNRLHHFPHVWYQSSMRTNLSPLMVSSKRHLFFCFGKNENSSSEEGRNLMRRGNKKPRNKFPFLL